MSTLTQKVAKAAPYVVVPGSTLKVDNEQFIWDNLSELGILNDDISLEILMSGDCREGDARAIFCDKNNLPVPRFRKIWGVLTEGARATDEPKNPSVLGGIQELANSMRPVGQYSDKELLELYGRECLPKIEDELRERTKGRNCIVFIDGNVDIDLSAPLVKRARREKVPASLHKKDKVYRVYSVGEFPEQVYVKCPVTGEVLFDGYSEKLGVKWELPYEALQFVHLLSRSGVDITPITARDINKTFAEDGLESLKSLFPKVACTFEDLQKIDELPSLKTSSTKRRVADPLNAGTRY